VAAKEKASPSSERELTRNRNPNTTAQHRRTGCIAEVTSRFYALEKPLRLHRKQGVAAQNNANNHR
jgi:hypothetical protein